MFKNISFEKYRIWFYLIVILAALPVIINIAWDFIVKDPKEQFWIGIRLIDFLVCGFCLIGGALCDRFNSKFQPSKDAIVGAFLFCLAGLGFYATAKASSPQATAVVGVYARDGVLMTFILTFYAVSILFSMALMRKTLTKD